MIMLCLPPMATVRTDVGRILRKCFREALARVEETEKAACLTMDVKQSHFSEEMAGERSFNLDSKTNLAPRVWGYFAMSLWREFGQETDFETAQRLDAMAKRMARMDETSVQHRRTA